jgi:hypothetical protein
MFLSKAFVNLKGVSVKVLLAFLLKKPMEKINSDWVEKKEGREISISYTEAKKFLKLTGTRFTRAIDDLIDKGFIELKYQGGGAEGDCSLYVLSDKWLNYGGKNFRVMPRPKKGLRIGFIKNKKKKLRPDAGKKIVKIRK